MSFHIRSAVLAPFSDLIRELGAEPNAVLEAANIGADVLKDPDILVPFTSVLQLFEAAIATTGCKHFGLLLGERNSLQNLGLLGLLFRSSPTLGVAIKEIIKHLGVHAQGIIRELHVDGAVAYISTDFERVELAQEIQIVQMSVAMNWKLTQLVTNNRWHPSSICFAFSEPDNSVFYRRFFNIPVQFNAEFNGIVFHSSDLDLPLKEYDPLLNQEMQRQVGKLEEEIVGDFVADVKRTIRKNMKLGICSIDSTVRFFPFQKRTFQKKLKNNGVTYQGLLDEVRFQKAEVYLIKSDINISQLADLLCYTDGSVFSTAFRKRYGLSPRQWKQKNKAGGRAR